MRAVVAAIIRKDLLVFFADRRSVLMSFVAPIALASFFGFVFASSDDKEAGRVPIRVIDEDRSPISAAIVSGLGTEKTLELQAGTAEEARAAVGHGKTTVAVVIPKGFGEAAGHAFFGAGAKPEMRMMYDPSHSGELAMVRGILTQHVMQAVSAAMFEGDQGRKMATDALAQMKGDTTTPPAQREALVEMLASINRYYERVPPESAASPRPAGGGLTLPYAVKEEAVTAREGVAFNGYAHYFGGMGVQFLLFACIDLAITLLRERQQGLWKRLRTAPLARSTVLLGKGLSGTAIALFILLVTFAFGMAVFHIRIEGSVIGFLAVCAATAAMAASYGLLIASLGQTAEATRGVAIITTLMMLMLSGAWIPSFVLPAYVQSGARAVPVRWAVEGLDAATWRGASLGATLPYVGALLAFTALFGVLSVARFRWEAE